MLEELINRNVPQLAYPRVVELATIVRANVTRWRENAIEEVPMNAEDALEEGAMQEEVGFDG